MQNEHGKSEPTAVSTLRLIPKSPLLINDDCIRGAQRCLPDGCVDLLICDPPFGIAESGFGSMYNRRSDTVLKGYVEAPADYAAWTEQWMTEGRRVLKPDGSFYVVSGHTNLRHVLNAGAALDLHLRNQIVWQYPFGVHTTRKFVTSHYSILLYTKHAGAQPTFNRGCRFADAARDTAGRSLQYRDREDVWRIARENHPGRVKNVNKLPDALVEKMIAYSSNAGDLVADFFLGNFTTAHVARQMGRCVAGFELNPAAFHHHMQSFCPAGDADNSGSFCPSAG